MRVETLLPIGMVDPGLRDVSMRLDLSKVPDMAREVEALGYDGLVSGETKNDPYVPLVLGAASTERIRLTTAFVIAFPRSPTVTALTALERPVALEGPLRPGARPPGEGPHRAALRHGVGAAAATHARIHPRRSRRLGLLAEPRAP